MYIVLLRDGSTEFLEMSPLEGLQAANANAEGLVYVVLLRHASTLERSKRKENLGKNMKK